MRGNGVSDTSIFQFITQSKGCYEGLYVRGYVSIKNGRLAAPVLVSEKSFFRMRAVLEPLHHADLPAFFFAALANAAGVDSKAVPGVFVVVHFTIDKA